MVVFDKDIVKDPVDELDSVYIPNEEREGPLFEVLNRLLAEDKGKSYHNTNPKQGHLSSADGCSRRNYLKYIHKLDDDLEVPDNDRNTNWTFTHGDLIHEFIQNMLVESLGSEHVTTEESVSFDIGDEFFIYGHADIVIRGLDDVDKINDLIPSSERYKDHDVKGFPDPFVVDIKTKSEFTYYSYGDDGHVRSIPKESNIKQLNGYMGILGAEYGCLLYYSKRNDNLEEYWIRFDEELFEETQDQIKTVLNAVNTGTPAPRDPDGEYMCKKFCKWYKEGKCPGVDGIDPHDNWDEDSQDFEYDNPEWA